MSSHVTLTLKASHSAVGGKEVQLPVMKVVLVTDLMSVNIRRIKHL